MSFNRPLGQVKRQRNAMVGLAEADAVEHLGLSRGQRARRRGRGVAKPFLGTSEGVRAQDAPARVDYARRLTDALECDL